jgi:hypothetical protein
MKIINILYELGMITEDKWRDNWRKCRCSFCYQNKLCRPWGAWAHQDLLYGGCCDMICKECEMEKLK